MNKLTDEQILFFKTLEKVQDIAITSALVEHKDNTNLKDILLDVTYETIYRTMELLDGYIDDSLQFEIVSKKTNKSLRDSIELHDTCADYLKCSD